MMMVMMVMSVVLAGCKFDFGGNRVGDDGSNRFELIALLFAPVLPLDEVIDAHDEVRQADLL